MVQNFAPRRAPRARCWTNTGATDLLGPTHSAHRRRDPQSHSQVWTCPRRSDRAMCSGLRSTRSVSALEDVHSEHAVRAHTWSPHSALRYDQHATSDEVVEGSFADRTDSVASVSLCSILFRVPIRAITYDDRVDAWGNSIYSSHQSRRGWPGFAMTPPAPSSTRMPFCRIWSLRGRVGGFERSRMPRADHGRESFSRRGCEGARCDFTFGPLPAAVQSPTSDLWPMTQAAASTGPAGQMRPRALTLASALRSGWIPREREGPVGETSGFRTMRPLRHMPEHRRCMGKSAQHQPPCAPSACQEMGVEIS